MLTNRTMRRTLLLACLGLTAAGAATAPADREAALQAQLDAANARIAALEAQVADLRSQLGGATARAETAVARAEQAEAKASTADVAASAAVAETASIKDNGSVKALKRIVTDHVRIGQSTADVKAILGEPKQTRGEPTGTTYVYPRADVGRQVHGTYTPGPRITYELTFDAAGRLTAIKSEPR